MKPGTLLLIFSDAVLLLQAGGYIQPSGDFDDAKFNDVGSDLALANGVLAILKKHGAAVPPNVEAVLGVATDVVASMRADGFLTVAGDIDQTKFNDVPSILKLVTDVETILKKHGVTIPAKVDQIFAVIPLVAGLFK